MRSAAKSCRSLSRSIRNRLSDCANNGRKWDPGYELKVLPSPHRSLVAPTVQFVKTEIDNGRDVTVLLSQVEPRRWRHKLLYNQRGPILEAALGHAPTRLLPRFQSGSTDVICCGSAKSGDDHRIAVGGGVA